MSKALVSCGPTPAQAADALAGALMSAGLAEPGDLGPFASASGYCSVRRWASSGLMSLTGRPGGPPLAPGGPVMARLDGAGLVLDALTATACRSRPQPVDGRAATPEVVGPVDAGVLAAGRAGLTGSRRRGRQSTGGSARLLSVPDGWVAVNLARRDDIASVAAIVGHDVDGDPWTALARAAGAVGGAELVERAQLLGVPAAVVPRLPPVVAAPWHVERLGEVTPRRGHGGGGRPPVVVDLSAMWAGPLCAHLLRRAGARVIKVESIDRPDGSRRAVPGFFEWLNGGHENVALALRTTEGRRTLHALIEGADVVIEASRPRALAQLGFDAEELVAGRPGLTWVSITGYGRRGRWSNRVAFGDDAAAAAGLVAWTDEAPVFCGDAVADPITGLYAAVAALAAMLSGGGVLIDVCLRDAAAWAAAIGLEAGAALVVEHVLGGGLDGWTVGHRRPDPEGVWPVLTPAPPDLDSL